MTSNYSLYFRIEEHKDGYVISNNSAFINTLGGNLLFTKNQILLEQLLLEIQVVRKIFFNKDNSINIEDWETTPFLLYFSLSTEIDCREDNSSISSEEIYDDLVKDHFLYKFSDIKQGDKLKGGSLDFGLNFFKDLKEKFEEKDIDLPKASFKFIQNGDIDSNQGKIERQKIAALIQKDHNLGSPFQKSIFGTANLLLKSHIFSWIIAFTDLNIEKIILGTLVSIDAASIINNPRHGQILKEISEDKLEQQNPGKDVLTPQNDRIKTYNLWKKIVGNLKNYRKLSDDRPPELSFEESIVHEYKSSFTVPYPDYPEGTVDINGQLEFKMNKEIFKSKKSMHKFIQERSLKTLVAFLNTNGGTLVIGMTEGQRGNEIVGIERDNFKNVDEYERNLIQHITNRIGVKYISKHISIDFQKSEGKQLCVVRCLEFKPSENETPAYLDEERTFRRTGPRTDEVYGGKEMSLFTIERMLSVTKK